MTWRWGLIGSDAVDVLSPDSEHYMLEWHDYDEGYPDANGLDVGGEYPDPVYNLVVENDIAAALSEDIERDDSVFGDT